MGGFIKINIFFFLGRGGGGGVKILWMFFGVITKLDCLKGSFLCIVWSFLKVNVQNVDIFGVAKFSNICLDMPNIPDVFFLVNSR